MLNYAQTIAPARPSMLNSEPEGLGPSSKGQVNFAPVEPLKNLKRDDNAYRDSSLLSVIQEFHNDVSQASLSERREIAETGRLMENVRSGKLVMKRDPIYGGIALVKPLPHRPRTDAHVYPLAQVNSSQLTSVWTLSRPRTVPRHFGSTNRAQIQHALIEQVIQHYDAELFDEEFHQAESLSMMDYGTVIIRTFYDLHMNTIRQLQPIIEGVEQTIFDGYGYCACGYEGTEEDFSHPAEVYPRCPDCGSYQVSEIIPKTTVELPMQVGEKEYQQGDIGAEMLPIPACNWDMRKMAHMSSYFEYRSEVPYQLIHSILGCDIEEAGADDDYGLAIINSIGSRGGSAAGWGRENLEGTPEYAGRTAIMIEQWYEPEWYHGIKLPKDEVTVSGDVIPKGVPLEQVFPDGMNVVGFNNMQAVVFVGNEKRRIRGGVYHIQSHSGVGKGTQDVIEIAEQLNSAHSANLAMIKRYGAGGGYWYDKDVMSKVEAKALLKPGGLVGISMRGTNYASVENALQQIKHGELSNSNLTMVAQLSNLMNIAFQTTEFTNGVTNETVNVNTLGGQQLLAAQQQQRAAAPLRMKGYLRARVFEDVIDLFRENIQIPKFFGSTDRFGIAKGRFVSGSDIPDHVRCDFVPDSELPTNTYTKQQSLSLMLEKVAQGGISFFDLAVAKPRLAAFVAGQFQADIPLFNHNELLIVCQDRVENLKTLAEEADAMMEMSGFYPPPEQLGPMLVDQLKRKLAMNEENHVVKAEILSEYLDDDEVLEWSPTMYAGMEALIAKHYELDQMAQLARQNALVNAQMQQQQQMADAQNQAAMQQQALQWAGDQVAQEDAFSREQEAADNQAAREQAAADAEFGRQQFGSAVDHERQQVAAAQDRDFGREQQLNDLNYKALVEKGRQKQQAKITKK